MSYMQNVLIDTINLMVEAIIQFYTLQEQCGGKRDIRRELFFNLVTNLVLEQDVYFLMHNLTSVTMEAKLNRMRQVMADKNIQDNYLNFEKLKIAPAFQFDVNFRNQYTKVVTDQPAYQCSEPFSKTIKAFL